MKQRGFAPIVVIFIVFFFVIAGIYIYKPDIIVDAISNIIPSDYYSEAQNTPNKGSPTIKPKAKTIASPTPPPKPTQSQIINPTTPPTPTSTSTNQTESTPTPTESSTKKEKPKNRPTVPIVGG